MYWLATNAKSKGNKKRPRKNNFCKDVGTWFHLNSNRGHPLFLMKSQGLSCNSQSLTEPPVVHYCHPEFAYALKNVSSLISCVLSFPHSLWNDLTFSINDFDFNFILPENSEQSKSFLYIFIKSWKSCIFNSRKKPFETFLRWWRTLVKLSGGWF